MKLLDLPTEILIIIFSHLNIDEIISLSNMNRYLYQVTKHFDKFQAGKDLLTSIKYINHFEKIRFFEHINHNFKLFFLNFSQKLNKNDLLSIKLDCSGLLANKYIKKFLLNNKNVINLELNDNRILQTYDLSLIFNKMTKLKNLTLYNSMINSYNLNCLPKDLTKLNLYNCTFIDHNSISYMKFPNLKELALTNCNIITDVNLSRIFKQHPKLEKIDLSATSVSFFTLRAISNFCKKVTHLNLNSIFGHINSFTMIFLTDKLTNLTFLDISFSTITDFGIRAILPNLKKLKYFYLPYTYVKEEAALKIISSYPNIEYLIIDNTCIFSNYLLANIYYHGSHLKYIKLNIKNKNPRMIRKIQNKYPKLKLDYSLPSVVLV